MRTFATIVVAVDLTASSALAQPPPPASYTLRDTVQVLAGLMRVF